MPVDGATSWLRSTGSEGDVGPTGVSSVRVGRQVEVVLRGDRNFRPTIYSSVYPPKGSPGSRLVHGFREDRKEPTHRRYRGPMCPGSR